MFNRVREWAARLLDARVPEGMGESIATVQNDPTLKYIPNEYLLSEDDILAERGYDLDIYKRIARDDRVYPVMQQRIDAQISREWQVQPGDDRRASKKAADFISEVLNSIKFDNLQKKMAWGVFYGYAAAELNYMADGNYLALESIKVKKQKRFRFTLDGQLLLLTRKSPLKGEPLEERKFWWFSTGGYDDDDPYGLGLAHYLYFPVSFKTQGLKFWLAFADQFGNPARIGLYPPGSSEEDKKRLKAALRAFSQNTGIILPQGLEIKLLEAQRYGTTNTYETLNDRMDQAITQIILSQTMTTDDGSSNAQAQVHAGVKLEVVKSDSDLICGSFNEGPVRWLLEANLPNFPGAAMPKVWRDFSDQEDLNTRADRDKKIFDMGYRLTLDKVIEVYGEGYEPVQQSQPIPELQPDQSGQPLLESAAPTNRGVFEIKPSATTTVDQFFERLRDRAQPHMEAMINQIREALDSSETLQDFADRLDELYPELDEGQLTQIMAEAMFASKLAGIFESQEEASGN